MGQWNRAELKWKSSEGSEVGTFWPNSVPDACKKPYLGPVLAKCSVHFMKATQLTNGVERC